MAQLILMLSPVSHFWDVLLFCLSSISVKFSYHKFISFNSADEDMPDKNNMTECKVIRKPRRKRTQVIDSDDSTSWQSEEEDNFILSVLKKDVRTTVSEVAEKNGQEKGGKTEDGATSDGVSDKAPDGLLMHREAERYICMSHM